MDFEEANENLDPIIVEKSFQTAYLRQIGSQGADWHWELVEDEELAPQVKTEKDLTGVVNVDSAGGNAGIKYTLLAPKSLMARLSEPEQLCYFASKLNEFHNLRMLEDDTPKEPLTPYIVILLGMGFAGQAACAHQLTWSAACIDAGMVAIGALFAVRNHINHDRYPYHENDTRTLFTLGGSSELANFKRYIGIECDWVAEFKQTEDLQVTAEKPGYHARTKYLDGYSRDVSSPGMNGLGA